MNGNGSHLHLIARSWSAGKITFVFAKRSEPRHHFVSLGDLIFNPVISGGCFPEEFEGLLQTFPPRREWERRWIVVDIILCNQFINRVKISLFVFSEKPPQDRFFFIS